ncbi:GNAT family N-acetyltransferase [Streptomyces alfalfae]|uniref:Glycosyl transferase family 1 n=1 Tax=Streptomyces alfalfae TaxID=1642299 RepID=A0ABN4VHU2_9ACTN|nr:glycosyl transferase family 1 [Streptomyces alfalfae]AYA17604.1 GNAT family N-acetyltransferase [Streptomyces fradiae]RXX44815.1 GNAT family N-acetyltransferase [Streptomyces alfalfae]RZM95390.1 GNAT family N-acetyltransferase [Streptomyces alfalfae]
MTAARHRAPAVRVCVDEAEFEALAGAWRRLYLSCAAATPFQSHAWLSSWWRSYGRPGRLRVVLVGDGDRLIAAAPLTRTRGPVLRPLGGAISDFTDVLIDDAEREEGARALVAGLRRLAGTALIDFGEVRPGACLESVYGLWEGPKRALADSPCLELPPLPMDELLTRLPTPRAQRTRAKIRKLSALGVESRVVPADEVETSLHTLLHLHRLQWEGRKVTSEHLQPRFREHLLRSMRPMVAAGEAVVTEFRLDGEVLAADLTLLSGTLAGGYLYGAHPRLRERKVDVATMLLDAATRHTGGEQRRALSLLRGNEPYKHHWRPDPVTNQRFLLARHRTAPLLAAAAGYTAAREWAKPKLRELRERRGQ